MQQQCPYGCFAYIQRKNLDKHKLECVHGNKKNENSGKSNSMVEIGYYTIEQNVIALRTGLYEETRQRHRLIADISDLRRQNQHLDAWLDRLDIAQDEFRKSLQEQTNLRSNDVEGLQQNIDQLGYQYKVYVTHLRKSSSTRFHKN